MIQEFNCECNVCEACGICTRTESECDVYHNFFGIAHNIKWELVNQSDSFLQNDNFRHHDLLNYLSGQIIEVIPGQTMVKLTIKSENNYITCIMNTNEFIETNHKIGDTVTLEFKSINVKLTQ